MIDGIKTKKLRIINDERGFLMEILRSDDGIFKKFGQVYITAVNPYYVKGWHYHKKQTDNFICIKGKVRVGLYDERSSSETKGEAMEFVMSPDKPFVLQIPPGVFHGFESLCDEVSYIINIPTEVYNYNKPDEFRVDPFDNNIPFRWNSKKGG